MTALCWLVSFNWIKMRSPLQGIVSSTPIRWRIHVFLEKNSKRWSRVLVAKQKRSEEENVIPLLMWPVRREALPWYKHCWHCSWPQLGSGQGGLYHHSSIVAICDTTHSWNLTISALQTIVSCLWILSATKRETKQWKSLKEAGRGSASISEHPDTHHFILTTPETSEATFMYARFCVLPWFNSLKLGKAKVSYYWSSVVSCFLLLALVVVAQCLMEHEYSCVNLIILLLWMIWNGFKRPKRIISSINSYISKGFEATFLTVRKQIVY